MTSIAPVRRDSLWLALAASLTSIAAWVYFHHEGVVLAYKDGVSHMEIARRVVDSPTTGFGQLGGVWLPLPHLLMLPFIWSNTLYYSGLAGSLVSMASYVATCIFIYKIVLDLTGRWMAALAGALVFALNPDVLYMQSTPMTELLLFACMAGMVYGVQRWIQTDNYRYLMGAGFAAFLGSLTRYEAWVLLVALTAVVVFVAWRKGYGRARLEGVALAYLFVAGLGIVAWLGWNQLIFGNALNWQDGKYAKPSLWVGSGDIAVGHWLLALKTYWYAVLDNLRSACIFLSALGLATLLLRERLSWRSLPVLSLGVMFPFFVLALEQGQRPLHVTQLGGDLYNVRFGLLMILPAAILSGVLASSLRRSWLIALTLSVVVISTAGWNTWIAFQQPGTRIAVLYEPLRWQHGSTDTEQTAARFMHLNYHGGRILAQFFGSESVLFDARISLGNNIYEGSYKQWLPALTNPLSERVTWIIMRFKDASDQVADDLEHSSELAFYSLVYQNSQYRIYTRG